MMKNIISICVYCLCLSAMGISAKNGKHVVLVTIDGFRPDFYLENQWPAPNLHEMAKEGAYSHGVNSVLPSMTYPSHTTIMTGVQPAKHGVFFNGMFERDTLAGNIYWNFHQIKAYTLWQAVREAGMNAASLNWPVSAEAPVLFNIPDIGGREEEILKYSYPSGIIDTLNAAIFHDKGLMNLGKDQNSASIAAWVINKHKPSFMSVHLFSVDHAEHLAGRNGDLVKEAIADADQGIRIIREAIRKAGIEDSTLLIVTGDHGFLDVTTNVYPNVWLAKAGLLENPSGKWKARFNSVGGSTFLYLKDKNDKHTFAQVKSILDNLTEDQKQYLRFVSPDEARKIGADPSAALILSGLHGASFGNDYTGDAIRPGKGGSHGYFPDFSEIRTGFICVGDQIKAGAEIKEMNLADITAIVVKYLGLKMPSCKGKIPAGLFLQTSKK